MKVTRKYPVKSAISEKSGKIQRKHRRSARYVSSSSQTSYAQIMDMTQNDPYNFSMADRNRYLDRIEMLKTRYDDMIRTHGVDLLYFRKFNTFFLSGQANHANMIYGQDTTATYYVSGVIRAFLNIQKQDFAFNLMGYQTQEQIQIWVTIDDFRARLTYAVGAVSSQLFAVPVTGDTYNMQYYGIMDIPQFYAQIYGQLQNTRYISNAYPQIKQRSLNSKFYKSLQRLTNMNALTGTLKGYLQPIQQEPGYVSGILRGEISYNSYQNIQNTPGWDIAPQVGDYFKFIAGPDIEEQYQIKQVLDKQLTKDGLNPLMGKYLFKCKAVRRVPSQEQQSITNQQVEIGEDIPDLLLGKFQERQDDKENQKYYPQYRQTIAGSKDNKNNKRTNRIAKGVYDYKENQDDVYGGYDDNIPSQQIDEFHTIKTFKK